MNVLQICNFYHGNYLFHELFAGLRACGVTLEVFVPVRIGGSLPTEDGPPDVKSVLCFRNIDRLLYYPKQKKQEKAIQSLWDLSAVDVINAHSLFSGGYTAMQLHRQYGIPYVVVVSNTDKNVFFRRMPHLRRTGIRILDEASAVIFTCPSYLTYLLEHYVPAGMHQRLREKSVVIPFGISNVFYGDRRAAHGLSPDRPFRVVQVGEINDNKNLTTTAEAVRLLREQGLSVTLDAAGKISQEKYEDFIRSVPFMTYHGVLPPQGVKHLLRQSDVFVMPSHTESFGLAYAEAMSQGLPILYTRGEGFDGHFPDGSVGYAVDDRDPKDVAEKIRAVIDRYDQMARNAYEQSVSFSWADVSERYQNLYQRVLTHR